MENKPNTEEKQGCLKTTLLLAGILIAIIVGGYLIAKAAGLI